MLFGCLFYSKNSHQLPCMQVDSLVCFLLRRNYFYETDGMVLLGVTLMALFLVHKKHILDLPKIEYLEFTFSSVFRDNNGTYEEEIDSFQESCDHVMGPNFLPYNPFVSFIPVKGSLTFYHVLITMLV